jgi:FkbH-like protein
MSGAQGESTKFEGSESTPTAEGVLGPLPDGMELSAPVKLIVWDLDDTLWAGTLSEGIVQLDQARIDTVRALNRRGIVNSICSKNDADVVRVRLEQSGLWDEFVFASVDWSPKGARIAQIVEDIQLRPESVLFIDDLAINRAEATASVPGIQTAGPEIIGHLLSLPALKGKDDGELSRLNQYRTLERKRTDRQASTTTNDEFLRSCAIRVGVHDATEDDFGRLFELVNRTNQLNFTKRRPTEDEFGALLTDPNRRTGYVRVRDRYGDYGICGFFSLGPSGDSLSDFLFSCRVLNMGVEQWVYEYLGRPAMALVGEVASTLTGTADWITADDGLLERPEESEPTGSDQRASGGTDGRSERVLMVGGCDLGTTALFLGGAIDTDLHRNSATGALIHNEHTDIPRQAALGLSAEQRAVVDRLPFLDQEVFDPPVLRRQHDIVIYSLLMDFTQDRYRHRATGLVVPWHQLDVDATDQRSWPPLEERFGSVGVDHEFLSWFADQFERIGPLPVDQFQDNIRWLAGSLAPEARLVLLNGAEVPLDNPEEPQRHLRHRQMNDALDQVVAELPNVTVCDVRRFARGEEDFSRADIRHYRRYVYKYIAEDIRESTASGLELRQPSRKGRILWQVRRFAGQRRRQFLDVFR